MADRAVQVLVNGQQWDKWPMDLYIPPEALDVFLDTFQGPLDLLLYLIRKHSLNILDIPVAYITRQYMDYVELMQHRRLDLAAEYLVMSATLAEIKSRLLLPVPGDDDVVEADPRAALVRRLQEYERFSKAARDMDALPRLERELYLLAVDFVDPAPTPILPRASTADLVSALSALLASSEYTRQLVLNRDLLSVREKMTWILDRIRDKPLLRLHELLDPDEGKPGLVVSFIAILELVRGDMLTVTQNAPFSPIHLQRNSA